MGANSVIKEVKPGSQTEFMGKNTDTISILIPEELSVSDLNSQKISPLVAIVPAYNEEIAIGSIVVVTRQFVDTVIVVDDGSSDSTAFIAKAAGAVVISHPHNKGKGTALMTGFAKARELDPAAVIMLDGDGQHNPSEIDNLIKPILEGKADLVIGSRALNNGNKIPYYRKIGQKILNIATKMSTGYDSTDSQSGFRAISRKALNYLDFKSEEYNIESDMIAQFLQEGLVITEIPIIVSYDVPNKHKKHPISHGMDIIGHLIEVLVYKRPLLFFGIPGIALVLACLIYGSWALAVYHGSNILPFDTIVLSGITLISGLLLIATALILNSLVRIIRMEK